jgi:hypothetical protein
MDVRPTAKVGDKVRLKKTCQHGGKRGVVVSAKKPQLSVLLETGERLSVDAADVSNFSLAARKAWIKMPERKVGRPKGSRVGDRISVTFRLERTVWEAFLEKERSGHIPNRTQVLNNALRDILLNLAPEGITTR